MEKDSRKVAELTVGLDLGDKYSYLFIVDEAGDLVENKRIRTTRTTIERFFRKLEPSARVALEVGTHSPWVSRLLSWLGHEVVVANARKLRAIYENEAKSDRVDAEMLARIARLDPELLSPIQHRAEASQADLAVIRSRDSLVRTRTHLINHVRGTVKAWGARLPGCSAPRFHRQAPRWTPVDLRPALEPVLRMIGELTAQIGAYDRALGSIAAARYPETDLLRQVPGVGLLTSLSYVLTVENPLRFKKSRTAAAYLGLTPRRNQSGGSDPQLRITKSGDRDLRRLLVQAAQYLLGPFAPDTTLRRWGLAIAERGGRQAKRRAVVAVARKLAVLLHRLWVTAEVYEPLRHAPSSHHPRPTAA